MRPNPALPRQDLLRYISFCACASTALIAGACGDDEPTTKYSAEPDAAPVVTNEINGTVFVDRNQNGQIDDSEPGLAGWNVFLDSNDDGTHSEGEPSTTTDSSGHYVFPDLDPGDYIVRVIVPFGWRNISGGNDAQQRARTPQPAANAPSKNQQGIAHIIGGDDAGKGEYPFMAAVGAMRSGGVATYCGAALISDRWVVTAAHCSEGAQPERVGVVLGANDGASERGQTIAVQKVIQHPNYNGDASAGYDVAIWQLAETVDLSTPAIRSIDLASDELLEYTSAGTLATAMGWGVSDNASRLLQDVHVPIVDAADCEQAYRGARNFSTQICAGVPEGGIDSCQGDSGGPLVVRDNDKQRWLLAGVTSYGEGCAEPGYPGVYARVSSVASWIEDATLEPSSLAYRVTINESVFTGNFGSQPTTSALIGEIAPRWQLTRLHPATNTIDSGQPAKLQWRILDEKPAGESNFQCEFDRDGRGRFASETITCAAGVTEVVIDDYADGVYLPSVQVTLGDAAASRYSSPMIVGTPVQQSSDGILTADDAVDPDFNTTYYIDYFEITDADSGNAVIVRLNSSEFAPYIAIYDADIRTASGGGELYTGWPDPSGEQIAFVPEAGKRYLVGVSTDDGQDTGNYRLTLIGGGSLMPAVVGGSE